MEWNFEKPKFKIGDLVKITESISFLATDIVLAGDIGLVVDTDFDGLNVLNAWGFDYIVLLQSGKTFVFFEDELQLIN